MIFQCSGASRRVMDAPQDAWRRQLVAWKLKKLVKSLQKRSRQRLGEPSEPQDAPGEPQTTKNIKNTLVFLFLDPQEESASPPLRGNLS